MNVVRPYVFAIPERLRALRLEAAMIQKARAVNLGLLLRQHEDKIHDAEQRCDRSAREAIIRLRAAVANDERWAPATSRDLKAAVRGLSVAAARGSHAPELADALAWLRDRLAEIAAQDARATALDAVLAAHCPAAAGKVAAGASRQAGRRGKDQPTSGSGRQG